MVLMAGASDHHQSHHNATAKPAPPATASPTPAPAPANRTRLHDFAFPTLSWGAHRLLRCSKDGGGGSASPPPHPHTPSPDKEKQPPHQASSPGAAGASASASQPPRPWNLRTRRSATVAPLASRSEIAAGKAPVGAGQALQQQHPPPHLASPSKAAAGVARKRPFSASLTRDEIAEDFAAIRGTRPPRRPKKRPRAVQRQLDMLYPGLSLADVNLDSYKIDEQR